MSDVFNADGKVHRRVQLRVFKRSSKDTEQQEVILPDSLRAKLAKFYHWKERKGEGIPADGPLFISRINKRLSSRQIRHAFTVWQTRAGFERRFSFHAIRHSARSNLYCVTRDIRLG